jgi:hypothetical protein
MLSASARAQLLPHLSPEPTDTILQPVAQRMCCRLITRFIHAMVTSRNCAVKLDCVAQQRDVTPRLTITRFRSGVSSMAISPRPSASLMAARALALPMLARSAIRAKGSEHFPLAWASFRKTASTAMRQCSGAQPHRVGRLPSKQETDDPTLPVGRRVRSSCWCRPLRNSIPCLPWIELCSTW